MTSMKTYTPEPNALRYRLFDNGLNMLYDRYETDESEARQHIGEFMRAAGHGELNYAIDNGRGWRTRRSGKVSAAPGVPTQWHDSRELLKYMLTPVNPLVD